MARAVLVVCGGAGGAQRGAPGEQGRRHALAAALEEGRALLAGGAPALDAVERALRRLESHALFDAGYGSALDARGEVEMDASIAEGATARAGAVCAVRRLAHPVSAARLVLEGSPHVLLAADGAESFALARGAEAVEPGALVSVERREQLARRQDAGAPDRDEEAGGGVGAVARDRAGHVAAATSTGGLVGALPGRVGDGSPIGLGCWARDASCAVSVTGHGRGIAGAAVAHEIDALLRLGGQTLEAAASGALARAQALGARAAVVAIERGGRFTARFTTRAMLRGWIAEHGPPVVKIFADE